MILSIGILFVLVVIDLRTADHQPKIFRIPRRQTHRWLSHLHNVKLMHSTSLRCNDWLLGVANSSCFMLIEEIDN